MIGQTIGNYVVRAKIGEGGMGVVYVAEHPRIGKKVAIKVLLPEYSRNEEVVQRFFTEARASSAIKNEHIIDIIDFGELPDHASYIIMEWLEGQSLTELIEREGALPVERVLHIASGIGRALAAAHSHGIVHRDLKPDNIHLVTRGDDRDFVKVLDFGIAKLIGNEGAGAPQLASKTRTGAIIGTPMYMSPEQCRGVQVDERSDTYSLAVIVYQMLAGKVPFAAEGLGELLLAHMTETPAPLDAPDVVARAVMRALEKDPQKRPPHVWDFVGELTGRLTIPMSPLAPPAAKHVSAVDTIGAAAGEVGAPAASAARWPIVVAVLVLASVGAAVVLHRPASHVDGPVVSAVPVVAPVTGATVTAAPVTVVPPPAAPAKVAVSLRATPAEATIRIDGVLHDNPYSDEVARDDRDHAIEISAPGHATWKTLVRFDRPVSLGTELVALGKIDKRPAKPHVPPVPVPAPPEVAKPAAPKPEGPTIYKGTKGTLRTDDPFAQ